MRTRCGHEKNKTPSEFPLTGFLVPRTGIEPARLAAHAPETCASTYSATWALPEFSGIAVCKSNTFFLNYQLFFAKKSIC